MTNCTGLTIDCDYAIAIEVCIEPMSGVVARAVDADYGMRQRMP